MAELSPMAKMMLKRIHTAMLAGCSTCGKVLVIDGVPRDGHSFTFPKGDDGKLDYSQNPIAYCCKECVPDDRN